MMNMTTVKRGCCCCLVVILTRDNSEPLADLLTTAETRLPGEVSANWKVRDWAPLSCTLV